MCVFEREREKREKREREKHILNVSVLLFIILVYLATGPDPSHLDIKRDITKLFRRFDLLKTEAA